MRYDIAGAYVARQNSNVRYRIGEKPGLGLCSEHRGSGVNENGRSPQSRYGDAAAGRGDCKSQILVNDGEPAKKMKQAAAIICLAMAQCLSGWAQTRPAIGLTVNGQTPATVYRGWPVMVQASLLSMDGVAVRLSVDGAPWFSASRLKVSGEDEAPVSWPVKMEPPDGDDALTLDADTRGQVLWSLPPDASLNLQEGFYTIALEVNTSASARPDAWRGVARSLPVLVTVALEPQSLSPEQDASKSMLLAEWKAFGADFDGAIAVLDGLLSRQDQRGCPEFCVNVLR